MSTSADERRLVEALPAVLGMEDVVQLLGLSAATVRQLVKDGHLRAHRPPGGRKWLFRADEVLNNVSSWSWGEEENGGQLPSSPTTDPEPGEDAGVDPTTIWCPSPPVKDGETATVESCAAAWLDAARRSGLQPVAVSAKEIQLQGRSYELRSGPRQRVLVVDEDGEDVFQLIDAVWVEQLQIDEQLA